MQKHKTTHNMETRSKHDPVITVKAHLCTKRRPWRSPSAWLCIARGHAMLKITSAHAFRNAQGTTASTLSKIISDYYSIIYAGFQNQWFPKSYGGRFTEQLHLYSLIENMIGEAKYQYILFCFSFKFYCSSYSSSSSPSPSVFDSNASYGLFPNSLLSLTNFLSVLFRPHLKTCLKSSLQTIKPWKTIATDRLKTNWCLLKKKN